MMKRTKNRKGKRKKENRRGMKTKKTEEKGANASRRKGKKE